MALVVALPYSCLQLLREKL
ncbi:hypothetical protein Goshw_026577 [Gossypium schwendimanii]|uniref:Uncharacterized protein n=1 Tax=Gossypium schwendimanii TaxID=34291 RepID=A0A7J9LIB4_GOSSC|nr:hypothetical protein [Gossypium schwendimanii]